MGQNRERELREVWSVRWTQAPAAGLQTEEGGRGPRNVGLFQKQRTIAVQSPAASVLPPHGTQFHQQPEWAWTCILLWMFQKGMRPCRHPDLTLWNSSHCAETSVPPIYEGEGWVVWFMSNRHKRDGRYWYARLTPIVHGLHHRPTLKHPHHNDRFRDVSGGTAHLPHAFV